MNWELLFILPVLFLAALYLLRYFLRMFSGKQSGCRCESTSCPGARASRVQEGEFRSK